ncbi:MAG: hypothetical protein ACD_75C02566G0002 [uncultured bacterium]|nr:MAG: hypothetical protein ACD_75C02566G0002 [uncultured bacterium]
MFPHLRQLRARLQQPILQRPKHRHELHEGLQPRFIVRRAQLLHLQHIVLLIRDEVNRLGHGEVIRYGLPYALECAHRRIRVISIRLAFRASIVEVKPHGIRLHIPEQLPHKGPVLLRRIRSSREVPQHQPKEHIIPPCRNLLPCPSFNLRLQFLQQRIKHGKGFPLRQVARIPRQLRENLIHQHGGNPLVMFCIQQSYVGEIPYGNPLPRGYKIPRLQKRVRLNRLIEAALQLHNSWLRFEANLWHPHIFNLYLYGGFPLRVN